MKSIIYILLVALLGSMVLTACPKPTTTQKQVITIQSVEEASPELLNKSCTIIKQRLSDYGIQNANVSANISMKTIEISLNGNVDTEEILPLLTSEGEIGFYETYDRADIIKLLDKDNELFSLLNIQQKGSKLSNSPAILGYCKMQVKNQVDLYIAKQNMTQLNQGVNYFWSKNPNENGDYYLYLLKQNAALDKTQVQKVSVSNNIDNHSAELLIEFNETGALAWQDLSRNNLDKPIAIVIDNAVYATPIVQSEIKGGKCQITGDFTIKEVTLLKSIISNDDLPLKFKLVK